MAPILYRGIFITLVSMTIKPLGRSHVALASELIEAVSKQYSKDDFTVEGFDLFRSKVLHAGMKKNLEEGYRYWGAFESAQLVGLIAMKPPAHLYNLFVSGDHHRRGIARALWNHVIHALDPQCVTVYSSSYAIELYRKFGFVQSGEKLEDQGVICYPMVWRKDQSTD